MSIKQVKDGWKVDFRAGGANGKRYRKTCKTKAEAERYQKFVEAQLIAHGKPWNDKPSDNRHLSELIELWYHHFGQHKKYSKPRLKKMQRVCERVGDPVAAKLTKVTFSGYRSERIAEGISPVTLNTEFNYLSAIYTELHGIGEIDYDYPLKGLKYMKTPEREMSFLTSDQIDNLLRVLEGDCYYIARICLSIGARWGEAESLKVSQVRDGKIHLIGTSTKNKKNRVIPINENLYLELKHRALGKAQNERIFSDSISLLYEGLKQAHIELPKGQKSHVLRHTFATHFMMNGGNILTLQKILDHKDIKITLKYAHFAPDHFQDAVRFNPLNSLDGHKWTKVS
ncbi:tyrosine-type recombinase/integrase [Terasakiella sp.]|uniref:phage integrase n=1 Tax=Terasakiella sp. TaxID=2034861 RepID=UPI003AA9AB41